VRAELLALFGLCRGNVRRPRHSRLGLMVHSLARNGRYADEMAAAGALDLAPGKLLIAGQVLLAMRALKLEFAHGI
jgi:hypothetical protein